MWGKVEATKTERDPYISQQKPKHPQTQHPYIHKHPYTKQLKTHTPLVKKPKHHCSKHPYTKYIKSVHLPIIAYISSLENTRTIWSGSVICKAFMKSLNMPIPSICSFCGEKTFIFVPIDATVGYLTHIRQNRM